MSAQPLLEKPSSWRTNLLFGCASFEKIPPKKESSLKISLIAITIIGQKLEVRVTARNILTYLKIVEAGQKNFKDNSKYHFESSFQYFPKDQKGRCTIEAVKAAFYSIVYLTGTFNPLVYSSPCETAEDLSNQLALVVKSLQEADSAVSEITPHIQEFLKSRKNVLN